MLSRHIKRLLESRIVKNVLALYGVQFGAYLFPLVTIPYLARVLGPYSWGMVAFAQSLGLYLAIVVEFGFSLSATRDIARNRDDVNRMSEIMADVLAAKITLAAVALVVAGGVLAFVPLMRHNPLLLCSGAGYGIAQGMTILWFYQGMERLTRSAAFDFSAKLVSTIGVFLVVHKPSDAWKVLMLQCVCYSMATLALTIWAYREVPFRLPAMGNVLRTLKHSSTIFLFRGAISLYSTANALILGLFAAPPIVAFYAGSERITRSIVQMIWPVSQSVYPRLSYLVKHQDERAIRLVRISMFSMLGIAAALACFVFFYAPLIIHIALGPKYTQAIPTLRILAFLLPTVAISNVLGMQWTIPLGLERQLNVIVVSAGVMNVVMASLLARRWQHIGMAWSVLVTEIGVAIAVFLLLVFKGANPFTLSASMTKITQALEGGPQEVAASTL